MNLDEFGMIIGTFDYLEHLADESTTTSEVTMLSQYVLILKKNQINIYDWLVHFEKEIENIQSEIGELKDKKAYTYSDGSKYEGEWQNKKRHGRGVLTRPDGLSYEGEWANNKPYGKGTLTFSNGKKRSGLWKDGKFIVEQQTVEHKEDNVHEQLMSQEARMQELEEANKALKLEISALANKVAKLEEKKIQSDIIQEDDLGTSK